MESAETLDRSADVVLTDTLSTVSGIYSITTFFYIILLTLKVMLQNQDKWHSLQ